MKYYSRAVSTTIAVIASIAISAASAHGQQVVKHIQAEKSAIAVGVWAGDTYYLSGQLPSPQTPGDPSKGIPPAYGDTEAQTMSALTKIQDLLQAQGLTMGTSS